jgi:CHAT domain-containing protein
MNKYLFVLLACVLFFNCRQIKKKETVRVIYNVDSVLNAIENDTTFNVNKYNELIDLFNNHNADTLQKAQLALAIYKNKVKKNATENNWLDSILNFETVILKDTIGIKILLETYFELIKTKLCTSNDFVKTVSACENYVMYAKSNDAKITQILNILGDTYLRLGDITKCKLTLDNALKISVGKNETTQTANILVSLSNYYALLNDATLAAAMIDKALHIKNLNETTKQELLLQQANTENNLEKKIVLVHNLLKISNSNYILYTGKRILANVYQQQYKYNEAIKCIYEAILTPDQEPRMIAKQYCELGNIYKILNKLDSAKYCIDAGLKIVTPMHMVSGNWMPIFEKLTTENTIMDLAYLKADIYLTDTLNFNSLELATEYLLVAKRVAALIRRELLFDESKYFMGIDLKLISEKLIQSYYLTFTKTKDLKYAKLAFEIAEESKSVALQDNLEQAIIQSTNNDTSFKYFIAIRKTLNDIEIAIEKTKDTKTMDSLYNIKLTVANKLNKFQDLKNTLSYKANDETNFEDLASFLKKHKSNALSYFMGQEKVYLFYLNASNQQLQFKQCDTSIKSDVQHLCNIQSKEHLFDSQFKTFQTLSHKVYNTLIGDFVNIDKTKTTLIFTDDVLNNLAFDGLLTDAAKPNSFLIKQHKMSMAYSIRSLISQQQRPFVDASAMLMLAPFANNSIRNLPQLEGSATETKNIETIYKANNYSSHLATFLNFTNHLNANKYIHIASHATAGETPKLEFYDSSVYVNSIYQIPMHQSLAYLNTCQSGSGINYYSEGNLSLGRAFYSNGVHNVLLSLWNMNDASSCEISTLFYKKLKQTNNSIEAMHEAKLAYLNSVPLDKQAPYYWASVQHIGDGILEQESEFNVWWILGGSLLLIGGIAYKKLKTK